MSDIGNTAFQVSPEQEPEMGKVREVFDHALNAIVQSSKLAKEVEELSTKVGELAKDLDWLRERNSRLDEYLTVARRQRDEAQQEAHGLKQELAKVKAESEAEIILIRADLQSIMDDRDHWRALDDERNTELATTKRDRDDAELRVMELEDENKKLKEQLEAIQRIIGAVAQAKPTQIQAPPMAEEPDHNEPQLFPEASNF